jgi:hypothetical protein
MKYSMQDKKQYNEKGERHGYWEVYWNTGELSYKGYFINNETYGFWINPSVPYKIYYAR